MILTVTLNPCVDKSICIDRLRVGEFNHGTEWSDVAGGKGNNAARMLKRLGVPVKAFVLVGGVTGRRVEELLRDDDGLDLSLVWAEAPTRTICTVREADGRATAFFEPAGPVTPDEAASLRSAFSAALEGVTFVSIGGSVPCSLLDGVYRDWIVEARKRGVRTCLDTRGEALRLGIEAGPWMAKPNLAETARLLGRSLAADEDRWQAVEYYREKGVELVVLSLGREGAMVAYGERRWIAHPPQVPEVNPVGSGDCLVAGMLAAIARGDDIEEAIRLGMACGAANAAVWKAAHVEPADVERLKAGVTLIPA
jgi:tagatose 6-phosphate kinase